MAERGALWQWLIDALDAHEAVALLIVVDSAGSSPGTTGAKMAVTARGSIGTIGGGLVESELMRTTRSKLNDVDACPQIFRRAHYPSTSVQSSGMICGGEQAVLVYPCRPEYRTLFEQLLTSCRLGTPLSLCISMRGLHVVPPPESGARSEFISGADWRYRETIGRCRRAYIIGAGHVCLALSKVLDMLDFDIIVIDDREQLESMQVNAYARQKWRISYQDIAKYIPEGPDVFVFIMTHSHHGDELVLTQLAGKRLAYLGLLGSQYKVTQLKNGLVQDRPPELLQRLYAPMGLPVKSHTPAEIAISIAAELIQLINSSPS